MDIVAELIRIVISTIILSPVLWFTGRSLVGKEKAKFFDAIWIVLLGTIINAVVGFFLPTLFLVAAIVMLIVWLALIKHFFDCGWLMAFAIAIVAVVIFVVIVIILGIIGLTAALIFL